jgi:hypothetical protein
MTAMRATRWDALLFARAVGMALVALGVALLVTAATDEGGVSWLGRAARTIPLAPVCSALGAWVALAPTIVRGEAVAVQALGRSPAQVGAGAVAGAAFVALAMACAVGTSRAIDVTGFYPLVTHPSVWTWRDGNFVDDRRGLRVHADGELEKIEPVAQPAETSPVPRHGRAAAAVAMATAGLALPMLVAQTVLSSRDGDRQGARPPRRLLVVAACAAAVVGSVLLFQAAAARRVPALMGSLPPVVLLAFAARRYKEEI